MEEYCTNCGTLLKENANFCQECGTPKEILEENIDLETEEKTEETVHEENVDIETEEKTEETVHEENVDLKTEEKTEEKASEARNFCPNCGSELNDTHAFCENCGFNLANPETSPQKENIIEKHKIPIIAGIIVAVIVIVGLIALTSLGSESTPINMPPQTVTVGAEYFEIPGEFVGDPSSIDVKSDGGVVSFSQGWSSGYEHIYITVMSSGYAVDLESVASSEGGVHKNLMGYNGYYNEDDVSHYSFTFVLDDKLCVIETSSPYLFDEIQVL